MVPDTIPDKYAKIAAMIEKDTISMSANRNRQGYLSGRIRTEDFRPHQ